ncbi:hypothetical protein [Melittangium boletus]|uniref:Uncharacterized protein n=1 Tax=Melittangium boletus DSM 14713 TaxID=1294270 RepID=A0A250IBW2_9BACT|nr:hypothetical protein [Melittangium boletus]ATB28700.1 hypothetical protein MEBOL_002149 [Melittangium boletus DSM 14713]
MSVGSTSGSSSSRSSSSSSSSSSSRSSSSSSEGSKTSKTSETSSPKTSAAERFSRSSFEAAPAKGGKTQDKPSKPSKSQPTSARPKAAFNRRDPTSVALQGQLQAPQVTGGLIHTKTLGPTGSFQKTAPGALPSAFERTPVVAPVPAIRQGNPGLDAINAVDLVSGKKHSCVTTVRTNLQRAGMKGVPTTTSDDKNNSRGMMTQMIQSGHWQSVALPNATPTTIKGGYGEVQAQVLTREAYLDAASKGLIPDGSVVFQTKHGWDYGDGAYGNDVGIVRNGAIFNYAQNNTMLVYSDMVEAVVLQPR